MMRKVCLGGERTAWTLEPALSPALESGISLGAGGPAQPQGFVGTSECPLYSWRASGGERPSPALEGRVCWRGFVYPRQRLLLTQGTSALSRRRRSGCYNVAMVISVI